LRRRISLPPSDGGLARPTTEEITAFRLWLDFFRAAVGVILLDERRGMIILASVESKFPCSLLRAFALLEQVEESNHLL
jgi:hypothetical protein